jgi:hypothetical protein
MASLRKAVKTSPAASPCRAQNRSVDVVITHPGPSCQRAASGSASVVGARSDPRSRLLHRSHPHHTAGQSENATVVPRVVKRRQTRQTGAIGWTFALYTIASIILRVAVRRQGQSRRDLVAPRLTVWSPVQLLSVSNTTRIIVCILITGLAIRAVRELIP